MRTFTIISFVVFLLTGCASKQLTGLSNKNTINCNGYRIDSVGNSTDITFNIRAYWCGTKTVVSEGNFFILDHNNKILDKKVITGSNPTTFRLKEGFYIIGSNKSPIRTSLAIFKNGIYNIVFIIGDSDVSVN